MELAGRASSLSGARKGRWTLLTLQILTSKLKTQKYRVERNWIFDHDILPKRNYHLKSLINKSKMNSCLSNPWRHYFIYLFVYDTPIVVLLIS